MPAHQDHRTEAENLITQFANRSSSHNLPKEITEALAISYQLKMAIIDNAKEEHDDTVHL